MNAYLQFTDFLVRIYSKKRLILSVIVSLIVAISLNISAYCIGVGNRITSGYIKLLDVMPGRSVDETYLQLEAYGANGRSICFYSTLLIDGLFPLSYGILFCFLLVVLFQKTSVRFVIGYPLIIILLDFVENISTAILINAYPQRLDTIALTGSYLTSIKWMSIVVFLCLVVAGLIMKKKNDEAPKEI